MAEIEWPNTFTTMQVCARTGATYRQVDYWSRTNIAAPSVQQSAGSGSQRLYSLADLWRVGVCKALLDAGLSLTAVREVLDQAVQSDDLPLTDTVRLRIDHQHLAQRLAVDEPVRLRLVAT